MNDGLQNPVTDAGRRVADAHNVARMRGGTGRWLAISLADGSATTDIYDARTDAVRHGGEHAFYIQVQPGPMPAADGTALLELHRRARAAGWDFTDPAQTPMRPAGGPLPTTTAAARLSARGFHVPSHVRSRHVRRRR